LRDGIGTDNDWTVYTGTVPVIPVEPLEGTPEQWRNGLSYEVYLAGGYSNRGPCIAVPPTVVVPVLPAAAAAVVVSGTGWNEFPLLGVAADALVDSGNVWADSVVAAVSAAFDPLGGNVGLAVCSVQAQADEGEPVGLTVCPVQAQADEGEPVGLTVCSVQAQAVDVT